MAAKRDASTELQKGQHVAHVARQRVAAMLGVTYEELCGAGAVTGPASNVICPPRGQ